MVLAESVCLISQGQGLGCERRERSVCMWEIIGLSPRHSSFCWHTAGTQLAIQVICPSPLLLILHPPTPTPPCLPTECQTCMVRGDGGGVKTEKTLTLMGTRKEEVMMGPTAPRIHLGLGRRGSISDRQVFLSSHTNPCLASLLSGPQGTTPMLPLLLLI